MKNVFQVGCLSPCPYFPQSPHQAWSTVRLIPLPHAFTHQGKSVLLIDDSIVRGSTMKQIVDMARNVGARKVYLASAAPPVRFQNLYGVALPNTSGFVAKDNRWNDCVTRVLLLSLSSFKYCSFLPR